MVLYGQSSGAVPPFDLQVLNARGSLFATRPNLKDYVATRAELVQRSDDVLTQAAAGVLNVHIGGKWPLSQAPVSI